MVFVCFTRNYATTALNNEITKTNSLDATIKEFKNRAKYKLDVSNRDLNSLLSKLKTHKADSTQTLEILKCCSYASIDPNQSEIVDSICTELKKHTVFHVDHFNYILQFAKDKRDSQRAQEIFDEMINDGVKPDTWVKSFKLKCKYLIFVYW